MAVRIPKSMRQMMKTVKVGSMPHAGLSSGGKRTKKPRARKK